MHLSFTEDNIGIIWYGVFGFNECVIFFSFRTKGPEIGAIERSDVYTERDTFGIIGLHAFYKSFSLFCV